METKAAKNIDYLILVDIVEFGGGNVMNINMLKYLLILKLPTGVCVEVNSENPHFKYFK